LRWKVAPVLVESEIAEGWQVLTGTQIRKKIQLRGKEILVLKQSNKRI
jgi:hypothetical protein